MTKIRIAISFLVVALVGVSYVCGQYYFREATAEIRLDKNNVLRFNGRITSESFEKLKRVYEAASEKPALLRIDSGGGKGHVGLAMGDWMREHNLDVYVKNFCLSTCANSVFPAGNRKFLAEDAMLGWHGGFAQENLKELVSQALQGNYEKDHKEAGVTLNGGNRGDSACPIGSDDPEAALKEFSECIDDWVQKEKVFFVSRGIDPDLPYYGQRGSYMEKYRSKNYSGFYYDLDDLEAMGIRNIEVKGGREALWDPQKNKKFGQGKLKFYKVELSRGSD